MFLNYNYTVYRLRFEILKKARDLLSDIIILFFEFNVRKLRLNKLVVALYKINV